MDVETNNVKNNFYIPCALQKFIRNDHDIINNHSGFINNNRIQHAPHVMSINLQARRINVFN